MHATEQLRNIAEKILSQTRTDLFLSMRFLGEALDSLPWEMDLSTTGIGTDAEYMRYNPRLLMDTYLENPKWMARTYLHIILHCLFLHPVADIPKISVEQEDLPGDIPEMKDDRLLWNLACDLVGESVLD